MHWMNCYRDIMIESYWMDKNLRMGGNVGKIKYAKGIYHLGHYDNARTYLEKIDTKNLENNLKYLRNNYLVLSAIVVSKKIPNILKNTVKYGKKVLQIKVYYIQQFMGQFHHIQNLVNITLRGGI